VSHYLIRDRDSICGQEVRQTLKRRGVATHPCHAASRPLQRIACPSRWSASCATCTCVLPEPRPADPRLLDLVDGPRFDFRLVCGITRLPGPFLHLPASGVGSADATARSGTAAERHPATNFAPSDLPEWHFRPPLQSAYLLSARLVRVYTQTQ
jgi:hypothetical protein